MHRVRLITLIFLVFLTVMGCDILDSTLPRGDSSIQDGVLRMDRSGSTVSLSGYWAFWPSQFIHPSVRKENYTRFEPFSVSWTEYAGDTPEARGFASYALEITSLDKRNRYAFRVPGLSSALRLYVNGELLYQQGIPATDPKGERMDLDSVVIPLSDNGIEEISVVVHLSNFTDVFPGGQKPIRFGIYENVSDEWARDRLLDIWPFGAVLAMGAYFVALAILHRRDSASLWLGLLCFVFSLRILCTQEYLLRDLFPALPFGVMFRLGYMAMALGVVFFAGFCRTLFPDYARKRIIEALLALSAIFILLILVIPLSGVAAITLPLQILLTVSGMYYFYIILRGALAGIESAGVFLAGFAFFLAFIVNDILVANRIIRGPLMSQFGILAIVGSMVLIIVTNFARAFSSVEQMSIDLANLNQSLTRFIPKEAIAFLGKKSLVEINLGDNVLKELCIMFITIGNNVRLTDTSARLAVFKMIGDSLLKINPVIRKYSGFVDKYLAEGVLVLLPDNPLNAVSCALEIESLMKSLNIERNAINLPQIRFSCGLHRGPMMLGTIGEKERMDNTVISDAVNIASRLNQFAYQSGKPIIASGAIASPLQAKTLFQLSAQGDVRLRGKDKSVQVFEVKSI